jgi:hypothetical protein
MASNQTGRATIWGFAGGVSWTGIGTLYKESGEFESEFKLDELRDDDNEPQGFIASGELYIARLVFTPVAASGTNTLANAALSLEPPAKLARVTLTSFAWAAANSATWVYAGGWKLAFKKDGLASYELMIKNSPLRDLSAPVS